MESKLDPEATTKCRVDPSLKQRKSYQPQEKKVKYQSLCQATWSKKSAQAGGVLSTPSKTNILRVYTVQMVWLKDLE